MASHRPVASADVCTRALLVALLLAAGCGSSHVDGPGALEDEVVVLAASSLTEPLELIADAFERAHPDMDVKLSFDGSSTLATAILQGAPADVFASADEASMARLTDERAAAAPPTIVATNGLEIAVAHDNPFRIAGMGDLVPPVVVALCDREAPCGAYAAAAFARAGLPVPQAGREPNVKAVLTKVQLGEADAGLVYRTDLRDVDGVDGVALPGSAQVVVRYPVAPVADAPHPRVARVFVDFLRSAAAQRIFRQTGFGAV